MARRDYLEKEVPWCTVILCTLCMICHLLVLDGNMATASSIADVGHSSQGWSNLGLDMAATFAEEIDDVMANMTESLNDGIVQIVALEEALDFVIATMGDATESSLLQQTASLLQVQVAKPAKGETEDAYHNDAPKISADEMAEKAAAMIDNATLPLPDNMKSIVSAVVAAMGSFDGFAGHPLDAIRIVLDIFLTAMMSNVDDALDSFLDILEPALLKVGEWYIKFGAKVQAGIQGFSTTIDTVEKLLDQIMAQSGAGGENAEDMEYNTYNLFAVSDKDKGISVQDLQDVAQIYDISCMQGSKAEEVHGKYDANQDAVLDASEYSLFTQDPSVPGIMAIVLRSYAKRLSQVSGAVGGAKLRDEVANAVVTYLQLVAAKNMTKVEWIADRLTNESLPMAFTADVLRNLALAGDDPEVLTTSDVGATVVGVMAAINSDTTIEAANLMSDTDFWASEGFDPADQPTCVERVSKWTAASLIQTGSWTGLRKLHSDMGVASNTTEVEVSLLQAGERSNTKRLIEMVGASARALTERNRHQYFQRYSEKAQMRHESIMSTGTSRYLFNTLLGGQLALKADPMTESAVNSGVPAVPATLEFAKFLAWNATDSAAQWQSMCFNYSGMSSTPADAFATQIEGMVKKTQGFMSMLDEYAGPEGMDRLRNKSHGFVENAKDQLINVLIGQLNGSMAGCWKYCEPHPAEWDVKCGFVTCSECKMCSSGLSFAEELVELSGDAVQPIPDTGAWLEMVNMLEQVQAILPPCIDNLKVARKEVSVVSKTLDSIFTTFKKQGLPVFKEIAAYYSYIWIAYFILLSFFTLGIMYYGFWASGYFGGPKAYVDEDYVPPETCADRCKCLCNACYTWCCKCCSGECVFWSCLLFGQLFVLIMFIVALVLTLVSGIQMFIVSGCGAIYVLGDEKVCTETMKMLQGWITTFQGGAPELEISQVCVQHSLMTCAVITNKLKTAAIYTIVGAMAASVLSFQLLIESAILHERARMRRIIDGILKEDAAEKAA